MPELKTTTDKVNCNIVARQLHAHGIRQAVVSPGSRNAPMIAALAAAGMEITVVVDERSAAFIALGKSLRGTPAALCCTSGTALLNYAPAVAEAYYRRVAMAVVSADRPRQWIDQDDSQTLRQYETLGHFVKGSYDIPADCDTDEGRWYVNRMANEAMLTALSGQPGPIHINVQTGEPLDRFTTASPSQWNDREVTLYQPVQDLAPDDARYLAAKIAATPRVMLIAGFGAPCPELDDALSTLALRPNTVVMTETVANLHATGGARFVEGIDRTLSAIPAAIRESYSPDLVITFGGAIISRQIKRWLRQVRAPQWHIGLNGHLIDCLQSMTSHIKADPGKAITALASSLPAGSTASGYRDLWLRADTGAGRAHRDYVTAMPWCDLTALRTVFSQIPAHSTLHLSNGTAVRYSQLFPCTQEDIIYESNRGVSGIDGSTSTAMGDTRPGRLTVLVTGDMSMAYDVGALATMGVPASFKAVVLCNGGGSIFRFIDGTRRHPMLGEALAVEGMKLPLAALAGAYGYDYAEASSEDELRERFGAWLAGSVRPGIFALHTDGVLSARVLRDYFKVSL